MYMNICMFILQIGRKRGGGGGGGGQRYREREEGRRRWSWRVGRVGLAGDIAHRNFSSFLIISVLTFSLVLPFLEQLLAKNALYVSGGRFLAGVQRPEIYCSAG